MLSRWQMKKWYFQITTNTTALLFDSNIKLLKMCNILHVDKTVDVNLNASGSVAVILLAKLNSWWETLIVQPLVIIRTDMKNSLSRTIIERRSLLYEQYISSHRHND